MPSGAPGVACVTMERMTRDDESSFSTPAAPPAPSAEPVDASDERRIQEDIPWGVRIAAAWSWRVLLVLAFTGVLLWLLSFVKLLIIPLLVAALLATLLRPVHDFLRRLKFPALLASISSILLLLAVVNGLLYLVGQELVQGFAEMTDQVRTGVLELVRMAEDAGQQLGVTVSTEEFDQWLQQAQQYLQDNSSTLLGGAVSIGSTAGNIVVGLILSLFTLIFFLADGERLWRFAVEFVPSKFRPAVHGAGRTGWTALGSYVRVQVFVAAVDAVGIGIGAQLLGVPLALPVAVLVFLGSFIPVVGAVVTGAIAIILALVANGPINALLMLGVVLLVQQIESNVLQPIVMGKAVRLHPLAVVLAVTAGTTLLGIVGALFAVPVLAFINRSTRYLVREEWRHDDVALAMEHEQRLEAARREAPPESEEPADEETLAGLKRRLKETVPALDPERRAARGEAGDSGTSGASGDSDAARRPRRAAAGDAETRRAADRSGGADEDRRHAEDEE